MELVTAWTLKDARAQSTEIFRDPFTLQLHEGNGRVYEERIERAPYVSGNSVSLFAGDNFGINVIADGDRILAISYQEDASKADVTFKFSQEKATTDGCSSMTMMLVLQNRLKRPLAVDGVMTVPGEKTVYKTTIWPIRPDLIGYETWPHPIVQLVLTNLRFAQK